MNFRGDELMPKLPNNTIKILYIVYRGSTTYKFAFVWEACYEILDSVDGTGSVPHSEAQANYGSPRIHKTLQNQGIKTSLSTVAKIMQEILTFERFFLAFR